MSMRWVTYAGKGGDRVGLLVDGDVYALEPGLHLVDLLGDDGERLAKAQERARATPAEVVGLDSVQLRSPIPRPPSIRDFSSFEEHISSGLRGFGQELGQDWYEIPVFYFTNANVVVGSGERIRAPGNTRCLDYELEVAAVVGKPGIDIDPDDADQHIAGYCIYNDWSARDLQRREQRTIPVGPGKGKDFAQTFGPCLVTPDELAAYRSGHAYDLTMTAGVNGREYSRGNLESIYWSFGEMLAYASRGVELLPGEMLCSGTVGSGCIHELSRRDDGGDYPWLQDGDEVYLEIEHLGRIVNTVSFGPEPKPLRPGLDVIPKVA
jgi:2-keto-4-pentenoate hydratase/2-oxohepta-3-ene-1,7-dioic acid hydratase in catechol pathway